VIRITKIILFTLYRKIMAGPFCRIFRIQSLAKVEIMDIRVYNKLSDTRGDTCYQDYLIRPDELLGRIEADNNLFIFRTKRFKSLLQIVI
jgi:hypothetical protein